MRGSGAMTLVSNGRFQSKWAMTFSNITREWTYEGTWAVTNGVLISMITKSESKDTTNSEPVGYVDQWKIIQVDDSHLVLANGSETNLFERK